MNNLKPAKGSNKTRKRVGRGTGSGVGKTSGRGGKGQTARNGGGIPARFEGGQMPLYRRVPKRGFNNSIFRQEWESLNIGRLISAFKKGTFSGKEIDVIALRKAGLVSQNSNPVKLLAAMGDFTDADLKGLSGVVLSIDGASESAKEKMTAAGAQLNIPVVEEKPAKFNKFKKTKG